MDLEENPDLSGFRKMHSEFDRFIQDKESKAAFLNLLKKTETKYLKEKKKLMVVQWLQMKIWKKTL